PDDRRVDATLRRGGGSAVSLRSVGSRRLALHPRIRPFVRFPTTASARASILSVEGGATMTTHRIGQLVSAGAVAVTLCCAWVAPVSGQGVPRGFPSVGNALQAAAGCLGAVGGRFAPEAVKVPGLRDIDLATARQAEPR